MNDDFLIPDQQQGRLPVFFLKRCFDIAVGLCGTVFFLLVYPVIAALIKLDSRGPVIYKQKRVGVNKRILLERLSEDAAKSRKGDLGGRPFILYKFRSMPMNAEINGPQLSALKSDKRSTRIGTWLRATHLDELPQFLNILKGDMSFIGPRPERPFFTSQYIKEIPHYSKRTFFIKPGLTGLAQVTLGYDDSLESVVRKSYFDLSYCAALGTLRGWIKMDALVLGKSLFYLLKRTDLNGMIKIPESLKRIKMLPFQINKKKRKVGGHTTAILRFNVEKNNVVVKCDSAQDITRKMNLLTHFGQKVEVSVNPDVQFDLEDLNFLINLVRKVKSMDGSLVIRNPHPQVQKVLEELKLDKTVKLERVRRAVTNFLTVDVECSFHAYNLRSEFSKSSWHLQETRIKNNVQRILDLLKKHEASATFFILGWVANRYPEVVQMIDEAGHEIGTHGYYHNLITEMTPEEFEDDLVKSLTILSKYATRPVLGHRGSNFTIVNSTLWALNILAKNGIQYDSSIFPIGRKRYGIIDYPCRMPHRMQLENGDAIMEFPMSTLAMGKKLLPIGGGGYLRLYPYRITDRYIEQMNRGGYPAMVYFHPWELDNLQERVNVRPDKRFQHYVNLHTTDWKLSHLMERFNLTSIREGMKDHRISNMLHNKVVKITADKDRLKMVAMELTERKMSA